jgi:hypothetical protein
MPVSATFVAWDEKFWDYSDFLSEATSQQWVVEHNDEDRRVFELEVESMLRALIPDDLSRLEQSYHRIDWSFKPKDAPCDIHEALIVQSYLADNLDESDVLNQLRDVDWVSGSTAPDSVKLAFASPTPNPPFPQDHLALFINDLKGVVFRMIWNFTREYPNFIRILPTDASILLNEVLFEVGLAILMDKLRSVKLVG